MLQQHYTAPSFCHHFSLRVTSLLFFFGRGGNGLFFRPGSLCGGKRFLDYSLPGLSVNENPRNAALIVFHNLYSEHSVCTCAKFQHAKYVTCKVPPPIPKLVLTGSAPAYSQVMIGGHNASDNATFDTSK